MLRRSWLAVAVVVVASVIAVDAISSALWGIPPAGFYGSSDGVITEVFPGGGVWRRDVRPGDRVLETIRGDQPEEWAIRILDDGKERTVTTLRMIDDLRDTLPSAIGSGVAAGLALLALTFAVPIGVGLAAVAIALAEQPAMAMASPMESTLVASAALVAPVLWFAVWDRGRRIALLGLLAVMALAVGWSIARHVSADAWELLDPIRIVATYAGCMAVLVVLGSRGVGDRWGGYDLRRRTDVAVLAATAIMSLVMLQQRTPIERVIVPALVILLGYPIMRGRLWFSLDRLGLGTMRDRARVQAIEDERSRVAREIHDTAIQDLAAEASAVEGAGFSGSADRLRQVADRLRGITSGLHPSELEDLGLGPALTSLVARVDARGAFAVRLDLRDATSPADERRIPHEVALACYRIAQEALGNALRHSGGETVVVRADIGADWVDLVIADDGVGIDQVARERALAGGHMGLASMRERARLVGADCSLVSRDTGVEVRVRWQR